MLTSKPRRILHDNLVNIFTDIYQEDVNMVNWQRDLSPTVTQEVQQLINTDQEIKQTRFIELNDLDNQLLNLFTNSQNLSHLTADLKTLIEMFACLFEIDKVGLRFVRLNHAMCPKFHVDRVPCRLITTYFGEATQYIPNHAVTRQETGLEANLEYIEQLSCGDVALLKGETWPNNEHCGLVHRSPGVAENESRMVLTLDTVH